jgi:cytosine/adenosine deaminase-related metal-dependent hydrolase
MLINSGGRDDIGALKPGMAADLVTFRLDQVGWPPGRAGHFESLDFPMIVA